MYSTPYDIVKSLLRTEKGTVLQEKQNKYLFWVADFANKIQIKKAVEDIFKVHVAAVNTMNIPGKLKRVRQKTGYTSGWKKAVVTLKKGDKIEIAVT